MIVRRLPWTPGELADEVETRLRTGAGGWSAGIPGAIAEWSADGDTPTVRRDGPVIVAATDRGAVRLDTAGLAAFAVALRVRPGHVRSIVFACPWSRATPEAAHGVICVGPDPVPLHPDAVGHPLWDLGLGRAACRFQIRTAHPALTAALHASAGRPWTDLVATAGDLLIDTSPHRVVDTAAARIEVYTPIPPPDGRSPHGPHTHLLARHLATGRDLPRGVDLRDGWVPVATHHP